MALVASKEFKMLIKSESLKFRNFEIYMVWNTGVYIIFQFAWIVFSVLVCIVRFLLSVFANISKESIKIVYNIRVCIKSFISS